MATLSIFNFISLNGFFKDAANGISWHQHGGPQETEFSSNNAQGGNMLLFGRKTYEMMAAFWPTPAAAESMPGVAAGMNAAEKIVFSTTLKTVNWQGTRIISDNLIEEIRKLKQGDKNMTVLGSGSIVTQLADENLVDEYGIFLDPVALGNGTPIFHNIKKPLHFSLKNHRVFDNGAIYLQYTPQP